MCYLRGLGLLHGKHGNYPRCYWSSEPFLLGFSLISLTSTAYGVSRFLKLTIITAGIQRYLPAFCVTVQRVPLRTCQSFCSLAFVLQVLPLQIWLMVAAFLRDERFDNCHHFFKLRWSFPNNGASPVAAGG